MEEFSTVFPYPRNPRVLCIAGILPHSSTKEYDKIYDLVFRLIQLDRESLEPIVLVINGPGGSDEALWATVDTINLLHSPVYTVTSTASSASALLFVNGAKGHRYIFRGGRLMLHLGALVNKPPRKIWQFSKGGDNNIWQSWLRESNRFIAKMILDRSNIGELLSRLGNWEDEKDPERLMRGIMALLEKDQLFGAAEAVRCGLADKIIGQEEFDMLFR